MAAVLAGAAGDRGGSAKNRRLAYDVCLGREEDGTEKGYLNGWMSAYAGKRT